MSGCRTASGKTPGPARLASRCAASAAGNRGGREHAELDVSAYEIDESRRRLQIKHIVEQPGGSEDFPRRDSVRIRLTIRQQDQARVGMGGANRAKRR